MTNPVRPSFASSIAWRTLRASLVALLLALTAVAYHAAPDNGFQFDDAVNIVRHGPMHITAPEIDQLARAAREAILPQRVVANVSLALDWWRGGGDPAPFQVTNVAIHAATSLAVLSLLLTVLGRCGATPVEAWACATIAAAVWAVHPIQVQAVTYIVQRMTSLAALFMLISVTTYIRARAGGRRIWFAVSLLAAIAAVYSKENAWILPALILLAEYTLCRPAEHRIRTSLDRVVLALPVLLLAWIVIDLSLVHGPLWHFVTPNYAYRDFTLAERLLTQPRVIAFHIGQFLVPLPERFSIEHDFPLSQNLWEPWTTPLALAALLVWIAAGAWLSLRSRHPAVGFLVLWVPATLAIESSFVALEMVFEHRMYLPSVGIAGLLALALLRLHRSRLRYPATIASLACVVGLVWATLERVPVWRTPVTLYEQAARGAPKLPRVWTNLATAYESVDRSEEAVNAYTRALQLDPQRAIAWLNRGSSFRKAGNPAAAESDYRRFIALAPQDFRGPYVLGALFNALGKYEQAGPWLLRARQLNNRSALPLVEQGKLYLATQRPKDAIAALGEAYQRDVAIADTRFYEMLGTAYLQLGKHGHAIEVLNVALRQNPSGTDARLNRGEAFLRSGQPAAALADFNAVIANGMPDARAHAGRAEALRLLGESASESSR